MLTADAGPRPDGRRLKAAPISNRQQNAAALPRIELIDFQRPQQLTLQLPTVSVFFLYFLLTVSTRRE